MKQTEGIIAQVLEQPDTKKVEILKLEDNRIEITADGKYVGKFPHIAPNIEGYEKFKDYRRYPIQLSAQSIILIHHFSDKGESFSQVLERHDMMEENQAAAYDSYHMYEKSAEQFFDQLEGHYSDAFLEALIVEATKKLNDSDVRRRALEKKLDKVHCSTGSRAERALKKAEESIK